MRQQNHLRRDEIMKPDLLTKILLIFILAMALVAVIIAVSHYL